jgi:hypothetical protein
MMTTRFGEKQQQQQQQRRTEKEATTTTRCYCGSCRRRRRILCGRRSLLKRILVFCAALLILAFRIHFPSNYENFATAMKGDNSNNVAFDSNNNSTTHNNHRHRAIESTTTTTASHTESPPSPSNNVFRGKLYHCGYDIPGSASLLFPDYEYIATPWNPRIHSSTTPDDILVYGLHGPCTVTSVPEIASKFHGKILFSNGEAIGNLFQDNNAEILRNPDEYINRVYQMGPYPPEGNEIFINNNNTNNNGDDVVSKLEREQSMHVYLMAFHLYGTYYLKNTGKEIEGWLTNPSKRRRNNQKYNAIIYLTRHCVPFRQLAATVLSQTVPVHYGNNCQIPNGQNATVSPIATDRDSFRDNYQLYHNYKYCLVMENTNLQGYVTEKLLNGFMGGCLPIYYGSSQDVYGVFTGGSFVFYDVNNPEPAIDMMKQLQSNDTLYEEMLSKPVLKDGLKTLDRYFSMYPDIANGTLNQKLRELLLMDLPPRRLL